VRSGPNFSTLVYWLTALIVLASVETYGMRQQMVQKNEIAIQPLLIVTIKNLQVGVAPVPTRSQTKHGRALSNEPLAFGTKEECVRPGSAIDGSK